MLLNLEPSIAIAADLSPSEWRILMLMVREMDSGGFVYGVVEETSRATYYRRLRRLASAGLVVKAGRGWQVSPEFAVKVVEKPSKRGSSLIG